MRSTDAAASTLHLKLLLSSEFFKARAQPNDGVCKQQMAQVRGHPKALFVGAGLGLGLVALAGRLLVVRLASL